MKKILRPEKSIEKFKNGDNLIINALGDSLTQGWMVRKGYLDFLEEMISKKYTNSSFKIINSGIPGNTAEDGLCRMRYDLLDTNPDLTFVQFALNDAYMGISSVAFERTISSIVERIKVETSAEIVLLTSVYLLNSYENRMAEEFYSRLINIANRENIPVVLVHKFWEEKVKTDGIRHSELVQADGVHPTVKGYELMARAIMHVLS